MYGILGRRRVAERMGIGDRVHALLPERPRLLEKYRSLAPAYPAIVRARRLPEADLLISSSYAYAHGFRTRNDAPHLCYCHGPLRHVWSMETDYARDVGGNAAVRAAFSGYCASARAADRVAANGVDKFLTTSSFTAGLIRRAYGRDASIVRPPVDCDRFRPSDRRPQDYFLFAGRMVETYKRPSIVVDAFGEMPDVRLLVAGDGPCPT